MKNVDKIIKYTSKFNLLYVEDDKSTREASLFLLENFFDHIVVAVDGRDGIEKFKENDIDLIITDINMPYLNGLEMISEIKKLDIDIKVIIFSANMEPKYFTESIQLGVDGYLIKPIEIEHLINILHNIVSSMRLRDEIKEKAEMQEQNHKYLQSVIDASHDSIMVISENYEVEFMSKGIRDNISNLNIFDIDHPKCYEISHNRSTPCDGYSHPCPLRDVMESKKPTTIIHQHQTLKGDDQYIEIGASPLRDVNGICIGIVETSRDITAHINIQNELKKQKEILDYKAHHDSLTGLANKSLFEDRLRQSISKAKRHNKQFALLFIDLNKFKWINDNIGHDAGDMVLKHIALRVNKSIREEDTFARIGGDEFTIIMESVIDTVEVKIFAQKILKNIEEPIIYSDNELSVSASIGISIYPDDSDDSDDMIQLIKYADMAMYDAKDGEDNIVLNGER